jgi:hypothetical protein
MYKGEIIEGKIKVENMLKDDKDFKSDLAKCLADAESQGLNSIKNKSFSGHLNNKDLFFSIHDYSCSISGTKIGDQWKLTFYIEDVFNFTVLKNPLAQQSKSAMVGWAGNDIAIVSEKLGAITPVNIKILFNGVWSKDRFVK